MVTMQDEIFGVLTLDYTWRKDYVLDMFGVRVSTLIRVEADAKDSITDNQRRAFLAYLEDEKRIVLDVETAVLNYYQSNVQSFRANFGDDVRDVNSPVSVNLSSFSRLLSLRHICFLYSGDADRKVGFVFDARFDPEMGVGVLIVNEVVEQVSVQDIVL